MTDQAPRSSHGWIGLVFALLGAVVCTTLTGSLLALCPTLPAKLVLQGLLLIGLCYFSGLTGLLLFRSLNALKYCAAAALAITFGLLAWGGVLFLAGVAATLPPGYAEGVVFAAAIGSIAVYWAVQSRRSGSGSPSAVLPHITIQSSQTLQMESTVRGLEVVQYPSDYIHQTGEPRRPPTEVAQHLVQALTSSEVPVGVRLEWVSDRFRLFFLTRGDDPLKADSNLQSLDRVVSSLLPGFVMREQRDPPHNEIKSELKSSVSYMAGEPAPIDTSSRTADGLTSVAEMLKRTSSDAVVQVWAIPDRPGILDKWGAKREFESHVKTAPETVAVTRPGIFGGPPSQESYVTLDPLEATKRNQAARKLMRAHSDCVCKLYVSAACRTTSQKSADSLSRQLLRVLAGSVSPSSPERELEIKNGGDFVRTYCLREPSGKSTVLSPYEAAAYFILPKCDLGLMVADRGTFHTNPTELASKAQATPEPRAAMVTNAPPQQTAAVIVLGDTLDEGGRTAGVLVIRVKDTAEHIIIAGNQGTGKTNTAMCIAYQLHQRGVTPLILLPTKAWDWRQLLDLIPDLRIFTAGDETTAPFRFNPFQRPGEALLNSFIGALTDAFVATWPSEGILKEHLENVFNTAFTMAGWDRRANKQGRVIMVSDLFRALLQVEKTFLQYSERMNQDFTGALRARFTTLLRDPLLPIFNTRSGLTVEELLSKPTIIEMRALGDEQRALLTSLLTVHVAMYLESKTTTSEAPVRGPKHALILEEAHRFLKKTSIGQSTNEGRSAQQHAINSLVGVLREARGSGLGVILIDQLPTSLAEEAVKLPGTTIVHCLGHPEERTLLGLQANCSADQIRHIGGMALGEAVVHITRTNQPVKVRVKPLAELAPGRLTEKVWTDKRVALKMREVFAKHPQFLEWEEVPADLLGEVFGVGSRELVQVTAEPKVQTLDPIVVADLIYMTEEPLFRELYAASIDAALDGRPLIAALAVRNVVRDVVKDDSRLRIYCEYMMWFLRKTRETPEWRAAHDKVLTALRAELSALEAA